MASRPSVFAMLFAAAGGGLLAYGQENPILPTSQPLSQPVSQPASQASSSPTSQPVDLRVFPLGDGTLPPSSRKVEPPVISDEEILGTYETTEDEWHVEEMRYRFSVFGQRGRGFQSVADLPVDPVTGERVPGAGSEDALILQPMVLIGLRQNEKIVHNITIPFDIVTGASVDALDAISRASRVNEAGALDVTTNYQIDKDSDASFRYGIHIEEPLRSWFMGAGLTRSLADDNATIGVNGNVTIDLFDFVTTRGGFRGLENKTAINGNVSFSQILSPTTLFDTSYGLTYQTGTLQTTYNSLAIDGDNETRGEERFPTERTRQAIFARLSQHIPLTRSTIKASYRYYFEDQNFGLTAHTAELQGYQYLNRWLYVRASYRFYTQSGVNFFSTAIPAGLPDDKPRTSDSDLAPFNANEFGVKFVLLGERAPFAQLRNATLDASFSYYDRAKTIPGTDLNMSIFSLAYGRKF